MILAVALTGPPLKEWIEDYTYDFLALPMSGPALFVREAT